MYGMCDMHIISPQFCIGLHMNNYEPIILIPQ